MRATRSGQAKKIKGIKTLHCASFLDSRSLVWPSAEVETPGFALHRFPIVIAPANARRTSRSWSTLTIDPLTGHKPPRGAPGWLRVWAYRDRPVYTYAGGRQPGDVNADSHGEFRGERNGFRAFWLCDNFFHRDQPDPG